MQDGSVLTAVIIHGMIALACVAGGLVALIKGHNVYRDRGDDGRAKMHVQTPHLKITAQSFGAVVMATAVVWAALGVHVAPDIKASPKQAEVYSFDTEKGSVEAPVVYAYTPANSRASSIPLGSYGHSLGLVDAFTAGLNNKYAPIPVISGKPAHVKNVHSFTTDGETFLLATLESKDATAVVQYDSTSQPGKNGVVFKPLSVSVVRTASQSQ